MWRNIKITHEFFLILTLLFLAFLLRLYDLDLRPLHHDESLHSFYSWVLAEGGGYSHTPMMHGPLQFQFNALIFRIFGDSEFTSRLISDESDKNNSEFLNLQCDTKIATKRAQNRPNFRR